MDPSEKPDAVRRSTRSTRGSIKPIVNIAAEKEKSSSDASENEAENDEASFSPDIPKKAASARKKQPAQKKSKPVVDKNKSRSKNSKQCEPNQIKSDTQMQMDDTLVDYKLTKEERMDVEKAFDTYDIECNNFIHRKDLKNALRALGYEPRSEEIQRLTQKYCGLIKEDMISREDFHELIRIRIGGMQKSDKLKGLPEEISKVFELFDIDKTGKVTFQNLKEIAKELGEKISDEELQEMIDEADQDGDHQVNESEFLNIMKKTSLY